MYVQFCWEMHGPYYDFRVNPWPIPMTDAPMRSSRRFTLLTEGISRWTNLYSCDGIGLTSRSNRHSSNAPVIFVRKYVARVNNREMNRHEAILLIKLQWVHCSRIGSANWLVFLSKTPAFSGVNGLTRWEMVENLIESKIEQWKLDH